MEEGRKRRDFSIWIQHNESGTMAGTPSSVMVSCIVRVQIIENNVERWLHRVFVLSFKGQLYCLECHKAPLKELPFYVHTLIPHRDPLNGLHR